MSRGRIRLWGFGAITPLVILVPLWVLALPFGFWLDDQHEGSVQIAMTLGLAGWAIWLITNVAAFVHVFRRKDLPQASRRRWLFGLWLLNAFLLPVFWWRLIRPLGERQAR